MRFVTWCAALLGAALMVIVSAPAHAQATRTWVSGVGDDANPCSRTAPCKTFAGAISKTAAAGEINCLDPGGFGALTITKSIMIKCDGVEGGVLVSGTNGINISTGVGDIVYLSGLDIEGLGSGITGINFTAGKALHVVNCVIRGFATRGILFAPGTASASLIVQDTIVADTGGGIHIKPSGAFTATATLTNVHLDRSLFGLQASDGSKVTIYRSTIDSNSNNGIVAASSSVAVEINVVDSIVTNTAAAIHVIGAGATIRMVGSRILDNATGIISSGTVLGTVPQTNLNAGNTTPGAPSGSANLQ